jgi:uncharacterized protein YeaO (DUF488 family)
MRYWPRGVRKERADAWYRELGTSKELIRAWKSGKLTWPQFKKRYLAELRDDSKQPLLRQLAQQARIKKITLLCGCREPDRCHRTILKDQIMKAK